MFYNNSEEVALVVLTFYYNNKTVAFHVLANVILIFVWYNLLYFVSDVYYSIKRCGLKKMIYVVEGDLNFSEAAESLKTA